MSSAHDQLWFRHPQTCWALGDIKQFHGKEVELRGVLDGAVYRVPLGDTHPCDASHLLDSEDIAHMNNMHEGPLLTLLERRYARQHIYTFTGDILISINPYKVIPGLYTIPSTLADYREKHIPHVYAVAEAAYQAMLEEADPSKRNQSMIVSGESGAGKTEACKHIMRYLATLSERYCEAKIRRDSAIHSISSVEKRVLDCNPFLEAFGNAKTVRNDNSSRFGKFTKIEYEGGRILGARMRHYLLEKARVVAPQLGERNYHIFYQLTRGASGEERRGWELGDPRSFRYLNSGGAAAMNIAGVDDCEDFAVVRDALESVGIAAEVQARMFTVLAGLLHLGNVDFVENEKGEAAIAPTTTVDACMVASRLLGAPLLAYKLVRRLVKVKGRSSAYEVCLTAKQAAAARDALAKTTYERMFTWLISRCNSMLASQTNSTGFIGILDIFGFEIFETNSFEQLCINYANEKLQNLFNHHIFIMEQEQYHAEGVDMTTIEFINNQPCVDLIEKKPTGILVMLDEVCYLGRNTTDAAFLEQLDKTHKGKHAFYGNPKKKSLDRFSVVHFAGEVTYCVDGFIDKNNDTLYTDLEELMVASTSPFVVELFNDDMIGDAHLDGAADDTAAKAAGSAQRNQSTSTIASKFKRQLGALNDTLLSTTPHYVRCVKPNKLKSPDLFDHPMILAQLLYAGVLETVRIRRQGYPFRETYADFWRRACRIGFPVLIEELKAIPPPPAPRFQEVDGRMVDLALTEEVNAACRKGCEILCAALLKPSLWTIGKTKLFLKDMALDHLMALFRRYHAMRILAWWKMAKQRRAYVRFRRAVYTCKKLHKGRMLRRKFQAVSAQVSILQAHIRRRQQRKKFIRIMRIRAYAAAKMQAICRMHVASKRFTLFMNALRKLQSYYHAYQARRLYLHRKRACIIAQSGVRMLLAKRRFQRMKRARAFGAVLIQAKWKGYWARRRFLRMKRAVTKAATLWRRLVAIREVRRRFACVIRAQAFARRLLARVRYRKCVMALIRIQAWYKTEKAKLLYKRLLKAAARIQRAVLAYVRGKVLSAWVQEVFAAAAWGDVAEMQQLLECKDDAFRHVRDIPVHERVRLRNRDDGMKSLLHAAAASGRPESVQYLLGIGADIDARDAVGATPAHKAAAIGDSHLPILKLLLTAAGGRTTVTGSSLLSSSNALNETALDLAISKYRTSGRRDHDLTVRYLLDQGAVSNTVQGGHEAIEQILRQPRGEQVLAAAAIAREREVMERRAKERREDPHYQFLYLSEQERLKRAEKQRAAESPTSQQISHVTSTTGRKAEEANPTMAPQQSLKRAESASAMILQDLSPVGQAVHNLINNAAPSAHKRTTSTQSTAPSSADRSTVINFFVKTSSSRDMSASRMDLLGAFRRELAHASEEENGLTVAPKSAPMSEIDEVKAAEDLSSRVIQPSNAQGSPKLTVLPTLESKSPESSGPVAQTSLHPQKEADTAKKLVIAPESDEESDEIVSVPVPTYRQKFSSISPMLRSVANDPVPKGRRGSVAPTFAPGQVRSGSSQAGTATAPSHRTLQRNSTRPLAAPEMDSKEPIWTVHRSATTGMLYYYNRITGETQWDEPENFDGSRDDLGTEASSTARSLVGARHSMGSTSEHAMPAKAVLVDSTAALSPSQSAGAPVDTSPQADAASLAGSRRTVGLGRNGWAAAVDEEGYVYYFHTQKGITQWERPVEF